MIYQKTKGLDPQLAKTGCYFLSILKILEKVLDISLSVRQINIIFSECARIGYVGLDADIKYKATRGIAQIASAFLEKDIYMKRVAETERWTHRIGHYIRFIDGSPHHHFVLLNDLGDVEYDPYSEYGSQTVANGSLKDYRYMFAEVV